MEEQKKNKIAYIGAGIGSSSVTAAASIAKILSEKPDLIIVDDFNTIEIGGIGYVEKKTKRINNSYLAMVVKDYSYRGNKRITKEYLISEYKLIIAKKSKLTANNRRRVEVEFNRHFEALAITK